MNKDILFFIVLVMLIIAMCAKSQRDFKLLTGVNKDNIYVNKRTFLWKGGVFIFLGIALMFYTHAGGILPVITAVVALAGGVWNLIFILKYKKFSNKKKRN